MESFIGPVTYKLRRVGNSNTLTIPPELEARGFTPGAQILINELPDGTIQLVPAEKVREYLLRQLLVLGSKDPVPAFPSISTEFISNTLRFVAERDGAYRALASL